tara:strand:+ start:122 stop:334 length:213 start_codon:yes stop_codon:yes gene_type:complete
MVKSFDIRELKTRYKQKKITHFTVLLDKNLYSLLYIIKNINEKSINKILITETADPTTIEIGIMENNRRK